MSDDTAAPLDSPLPLAAQQLPPHLGQHVADLVEQLVRLVEPAGDFGAASRLTMFLLPILDLGEEAGDLRNRSWR